MLRRQTLGYCVLYLMAACVLGDSSSEVSGYHPRGWRVPRPQVIYPPVAKPPPYATTPPTTKPPTQASHAWTFAVTFYQKPYAYLKRAKMVGFTVDLIHHVCRVAKVKCYVVYLPTRECSITVDGTWFPGSGLMQREFDACVWWPITTERKNTVEFTAPYRQEKLARWLVRTGNPNKFDPLNLGDRKIVTIKGWYPTHACLESIGRQGGNFVVANSPQDAAYRVKSGEADALFSQLSVGSGLQVLTDVVRCTTGSGMMVTKNSALPAWWNTAFTHYVRCGCYKKLCSDAGVTHGRAADCIDLNTGYCTAAERSSFCGV